jgi:hypothetical protein
MKWANWSEEGGKRARIREDYRPCAAQTFGISLPAKFIKLLILFNSKNSGSW